ncbi:MAG: phenylacetate--CoA ligase family protein [Phycisphaerales bacterium]|nr:phenylacetate--CoA ligase family protein [Phycisphaerales bacterium]
MVTSRTQCYIADEEGRDAAALHALQRRKLANLLSEVLATNAFYRAKLSSTRFDPLIDPLEKLPFTTRAELEQDQLAAPPYGTTLTYPIERYSRYHQTSGTGGRSMRWLDTAESWAWFGRCWGIIFTAAGVSAADRIMFAFSFGPFVGFWGAFEGGTTLGALCLPGGGLSTQARLRMLLENRATVVCCTPTYALHMAEVAAHEGLDLPSSPVRALIVAGEPGGSIPATRRRIEAGWGARVFDHSGMTEIGAAGFECTENPGGLHVIESEFIPEVIDPQSARPVPNGQLGELVLTNLGRTGSPLIRYRTGDQVRLVRGPCACGRSFARLEGGILGRVDDMFVVRGNNVFPTAVEAVLRRFDEVAEFRVTVHENGALTQVKLEVEPTPQCASAPRLAEQVGQALHEALHFRAEVVMVGSGALPRFELKAKRFVRVKEAH